MTIRSMNRKEGARSMTQTGGETKLYMRQVTLTITGADRDEVRNEAMYLEWYQPQCMTNIRVSSTQEKLVERGED